MKRSLAWKALPNAAPEYPARWGGDYDLLLVWPDGSNGCGGYDRTALAWYVKQ
jgi:hypothetical protein